MAKRLLAIALVTAGLLAMAMPVAAAADDAKVEALLRRGDDMYKSRRFEAALAAYREAQSSAPSSTVPLRKEALCLIRTGDLKSALTALDRALGLEPENAACLNMRAVVLLRSRRPEEAIAPALKATRVEPDTAGFWDTLGQAYVATAQLEAARAAYKRALKLDPKHESARSGLAGTRLE